MTKNVTAKSFSQNFKSWYKMQMLLALYINFSFRLFFLFDLSRLISYFKIRNRLREKQHSTATNHSKQKRFSTGATTVQIGFERKTRLRT